MYLETLRAHHRYLSSLVVQPRDMGRLPAGLGDAPAAPLPPGFVERDGLLYRTGEDRRETLFDAFGVYDPLEGRVEGDHYATSHYVLMSAALHQVTGEPEYLRAAVDSAEFCLRGLCGYPRVPWGMHFDFNNYGLALACLLLGDSLPEEIRTIWLRDLVKARMNAHRVGNWFGQRLVFLALLRGSGVRLPLRSRLLLEVNRLFFRRTFATDGAIEDHRGTSRPIQYQAFSLALATLLDAVAPDGRTARSISPGIDYLLRFIAPDGDFNFFGRGHKQIFAYSPALYVLEACAPERPELRDAADRIWAFLRPHQREDGSFPLVLTPGPAAPRLGWYDYHRHSAYNAFFGAWLALAQIARQGNLRPRPGASDPPRAPRQALGGTVNIFIKRTPAYYLCLSRGFGGYSSECALSPHKLYVNALGTLLSCPGGPAPTVHGFGQRFTFAKEPVNIFAPLWRDAEGRWHSSGMTQTPLALRDGRPSFSLAFGPMKVTREFILSESTIEIRDVVTVAPAHDAQGQQTMRLVNLPLNVQGKTWSLDGNRIRLRNDETKFEAVIEIQALASLCHVDTYPWVDGDIALIVMESPLAPGRHEISYRIAAVPRSGKGTQP